MANKEPSPPERILLVEGIDDEQVVKNLRVRDNNIPAFCVRGKGGIDRLLAGIGLELKASGRKVVGIVADANGDVDARWQAVTERLRRENLETPATLELAGTIINESDRFPRIGIWLMPDNQSSGEIEDFVERMIPPDDPIWPLSRDYVDGIPQTHRKFQDGKILRAKVHAWLATRESPRLMGAAILAGDLNLNEPNSEVFANWLQRLFT